MRKKIILVLLIVLFGCKNEKKEIINTFNDFNTANIELNGEKIYELTDSETHKYYSRFLSKTLKLDSIEITELNLTEKINLLSARAIIKDSILKKISPKDLMIKIYIELSTMDSTQINAIKELGIANIQIDNKKAICDFIINGDTLSPNVNLRFSKENGQWKYNPLSMADYTEKRLETICKYQGFSHMEFIEWIFSASNMENKKVKELNEIWNPIIK
ncbi:hypothetical protein [uncultured Maribacter sp.]|uniref:hypothetical protein n=1 Tax=uncultured Maribacter sp. TaxID=431308 RepID=UPI0026267BD5|nr:hypothetical protein [uncultured Maribacter sp.]